MTQDQGDSRWIENNLHRNKDVTLGEDASYMPKQTQRSLNRREAASNVVKPAEIAGP
jgi:hypothetical protein